MASGSTKVVVAMALLGMVPMAAGCLAVAAGAAAVGTYAYVEGKLTETLKAAPDKVADATVKAFETLKLTLVSKEASGLEGKVTGKTSDDKNVTVDIKSEAQGVSKVGIRFGTFGDEAKSKVLMEEIKKNLS
jgi:hypothetical protein